MNSRAVPRNGYDCLAGSPEAPARIGYVTSGNYAPTLGGTYALCMVAKNAVNVGDTVYIPIHGRLEAGTVVKRPFMQPNAGHKHDK
jgi:glycine cleavage system aminomethyltransferase T